MRVPVGEMALILAFSQREKGLKFDRTLNCRSGVGSSRPNAKRFRDVTIANRQGLTVNSAGTSPPTHPHSPNTLDCVVASGGLTVFRLPPSLAENTERALKQKTLVGMRQFVRLSWLLKAPRVLQRRSRLNPPACRMSPSGRLKD